jgi:hypothetical protein
VVYGELGDSNFTSARVGCGGGFGNVCLAYLSVPVISFRVAKGGDYIDSSAAAGIRDLGFSVRAEKERGFRFNGLSRTRSITVARVLRRPDPDSCEIDARRIFEHRGTTQTQAAGAAGIDRWNGDAAGLPRTFRESPARE